MGIVGLLGVKRMRQSRGGSPERPLLVLTDSDRLTRADFGTSVSVIADSGSGKTTGILSNLYLGAYRHGASVIHVTVKGDDRDYLCWLAAAAGREVRVIDPERDRFNPLVWEQFRPLPVGVRNDAGARIEAITQEALLPLKRQRREGGGGDSFWLADSAVLIRHIVTAYVLAGMPLSFRAIARSVLNMPLNVEETQTAEWRSRCPVYAALVEAERRVASATGRQDLEAAAAHVFRTFPNTPHETRASTQATLVSSIDPYLRGIVGEALNADVATWTPRELIDGPRIVIVNTPSLVLGEAGRIIGRFMLTAVQNEVLRRADGQNRHLVVVACDEYQDLVDPDQDAKFMRLARSHGGCMVWSTQGIPNLRSGCASAADPKAAADAIAGLPGVKFFGASTCPETMRHAADVFATSLQPRVSLGTSEGERDAKGRPKRGDTANVSFDLQREVAEGEFAALARGGPENGFRVEAYCSVSGRRFSNGRTSFKAAFPQWFPQQRLR